LCQIILRLLFAAARFGLTFETITGRTPAMLDRLAMSERVITGWENLGKPGGRAEDNLLLIRDELAALAKIAAEHPAKSETVTRLGERYSAMAMRIRLSAN
jgi:hypothetical protein